MQYTEFFWDFDGTLFDTYPRVNRAMQKALREFNVEISLDALRPLTKVTLGNAARTLVKDATPHDVMAAYHRYAELEEYDTMPLYPGAREMLEGVLAHGGRNYLYTHRDVSALDALRHYGIEGLFCDFVTGADGFPNKPAPDALLYMISKHQLNPTACVMVGDRDIDLLAGINAGMAGAMFDPEGYYPDFKARHRYTDMRDMLQDLVLDGRGDLTVSAMLDLQMLLQQKHACDWGGLSPDKAPRQMLWMLGEAGEVIDVIKKMKPADITDNQGVRARFVEEMADVLMYFNDVLLCYGITAQEFAQAYRCKMDKNLGRDYAREHVDKYGVEGRP